jgi:hypothetical protein
MITVSKTIQIDVDADVNMSDINTDDLIAELNIRGVYVEHNDPTDLTVVDERNLLMEMRDRGFFASKFGALNNEDLEYLLSIIPLDTRPGTHAYFVYEKLRDIYINGQS